MKAFVLGASGSMGVAIVKELHKRGIATVAAARNEDQLTTLFSNLDVETKSCDAFLLNELQDCAQGCTHLFMALNIPYGNWRTGLPILFSNIIETARKENLSLILVDNIYCYGEQKEALLTEETPMRPSTKKGKIRVDMINRLHEAEVPYLIAHFPDFYGPHAYNTVLHLTLEKIAKNKRAQYVGDPALAREFIYTPDGAEALVHLALSPKCYNQHWNIPGAGTITGHDIIEIARKSFSYERSVATINRRMLSLAGLFSSQLREVKELFYLYEKPHILSGSKYEREIGPLPKTPYEKGIAETLKSLASR
ncbi:NAD-dependent epimerase/dehydratase family protein [Bacillus testis]|uniref:NAD-dependent epimerase/dehydratase family protein n=1 Tax=Bacillus testis TaxID=1622072 RepID=UPI00067EAE15|nr:NAD-dependent epimerase/dehydratase family protein [Bacillus testis]